MVRVAEGLGWQASDESGGGLGSGAVRVVMGWAAVMGLWMMDWAAVARSTLGFRAGLLMRLAVVVEG